MLGAGRYSMTNHLIIDYETAPCPLGWFAIGTTAKGLCALELGDRPHELPEQLAASFPGARLRSRAGAASQLLTRVQALLHSPRSQPDLPLDLQGTPFQKEVWQALRQIPAGTTLSYSQLAEQLGRPGAARAVARACAANRVAVVVPCHRVIRQDGLPGGYRWGLARKQLLLRLEAGDS